MRIFFVGTVEFSRKALIKLSELNAHVVGVATLAASAFNSDYSDLSDICIQNKIELKYLDNIHSAENMSWIRTLKPDIIFCFGWSKLLKKELLDIAPLGVVGYHPAALPLNRGRHPLIWALALGLKQTASTFFFMDEGADSGDILSQEKLLIAYEDDAFTLYRKVTDIALKQIEDFLPKLIDKSYLRIPQDHSRSNIWRKRGVADGKIDFRMSSRAIYNLVRALAKPYPGAHVVYKDREVKVWKVNEVDREHVENIEPGKVLSVTKNNIIVKTYDAAVELTAHEFIDLPQEGQYL